jgi:hypothetical protein
VDITALADAGGDASLFTDTAELAAAPENPISWVKTGVDIVQTLSKIFGGGGAGYAQNRGIRLTGALSPAGFTGSAYTITTAGNNPFNQAAFDSSVAINIKDTYSSWVNNNFGNVTIPIDLTSPTADWSSVFTTLGSYLQTGLDRTKMAANDISTVTGATDPTGASVAATDAAPPGAAGVATSVSPAAVAASGGGAAAIFTTSPALVGIALAIAAFLLKG